ncbi:hypothetical protein [Roseibium sp. MMSF_3412]|uniref:hypothetical protein n=1 Tax=Roseibium sp. MMSF_3412 TaxID=3046712 RepID=UPI00273D42C1|nr:hypothetical protein [Roseibium sp. MMSF_3412]
MHAAAHTGHHREDQRGRDDQTDGGSLSRSEDGSGNPGTNRAPSTRANEDPSCSAEQVKAALVNALESPEFRSAPQLRSFLDFVVCAALEKKQEKIKGYTIAVEALGRPEDFNPVTDPIVRVEAARLRRRLAKYYSGSGAREQIRIVIPKGSYAPEFDPRPVAEHTGPAPGRVMDEVSAPALRESTGETGTSGPTATPEASGGLLSGPQSSDAEPSPLHTYKVVQPLNGRTTQPLFQKRISPAFAIALALACFLAGFLAGSL